MVRRRLFLEPAGGGVYSDCSAPCCHLFVAPLCATPFPFSTCDSTHHVFFFFFSSFLWIFFGLSCRCFNKSATFATNGHQEKINGPVVLRYMFYTAILNVTLMLFNMIILQRPKVMLLSKRQIKSVQVSWGAKNCPQLKPPSPLHAVCTHVYPVQVTVRFRRRHHGIVGVDDGHDVHAQQLLQRAVQVLPLVVIVEVQMCNEDLKDDYRLMTMFKNFKFCLKNVLL